MVLFGQIDSVAELSGTGAETIVLSFAVALVIVAAVVLAVRGLLLGPFRSPPEDEQKPS